MPFLDSVSLEDFSSITVNEFDSYKMFQSWLRQRLLEIDKAVNSVDSEKEITKIGLQISDEVRRIELAMRQAQKRRAMSVAGVSVGTVTATLTAVMASSQVMASIAAFIGGASGGLWSVIQAGVGDGPQQLRGGPWYYIWTLSRAGKSED